MFIVKKIDEQKSTKKKNNRITKSIKDIHGEEKPKLEMGTSDYETWLKNGGLLDNFVESKEHFKLSHTHIHLEPYKKGKFEVSKYSN
jgi:hypothetical protein